MNVLPWVLIVLAFPVTPLVVNWIRHRPRYLDQGTQHIASIGTGIQMILLCLGLALLVPRWL